MKNTMKKKDLNLLNLDNLVLSNLKLKNLKIWMKIQKNVQYVLIILRIKKKLGF